MDDPSKRNAVKAAISTLLLSQVAAAVAESDSQAASGASGSASPASKKKKKSERPRVVHASTPKSVEAAASPMARIEGLRKKVAGMKATKEHELRASISAAQKELDRIAPRRREETRKLSSITSLRSSFAFVRTGQQFSPIRFDVLAAQASSLIDRCKQSRREWELLYQTTADFYYDLETFEELDAIHKLETAAGYYDLDAQASKNDLDAANALRFSNEMAANVLALTQDDISSNFNAYYGWIQLVAWLSHISGYQHGAADNTVRWNGVEKTVIAYSQDAAVAQGQLALQSAINQLESDRSVKQGQADAISQRMPSLRSRSIWDAANINFRKQRTELLRDLYKRKTQAASQADGPLNYLGQLDHLRSSYDGDLSAALERLLPIARGFALLMGYEKPLPNSVSAPGNSTAQPSASVLDDAEVWMREAGNWYTHFLETEQTGSTVISIRHVVTAADWSAFKKGADLAFDVSTGMLPNQRHIRLRSISLYADASGSGWFSAKVNCPNRGLYIHLDDSQQVVDQSSIPALRAGRVDRVDSRRPPERIGSNAAYNASPIGTWRLSMSEVGSDGERRTALSDLFLEINYAFQEAR